MLAPTYTFTFLSLIGLISFFVGLVIWFLYRIKRKEIPYPILSLFVIKKAKPSLKLKKKHLFLFLCFSIFSTSVLLYTLKPNFKSIQKTEKKTSKLHILIDLSASVSSTIEIESYKKKIQNFIRTQKEHFKISVSDNSLNSKIIEENYDDYLKHVEFLKTNETLSRSAGAALHFDAQLDYIVIFSDKDKYTWKNFDWENLQKEKGVFLINSGTIPENKSNIYIHSLDSENISDHQYIWQVVLNRSKGSQNRSGSLQVFLEDKLLEEKKWTLLSSQQEIQIPIALLKSTFEKSTQESILSFQIVTESDDLIKLDNTYETFFNLDYSQSLLIRDPQSESVLKDPAYHLENTLTLLGYKTTRLDWIQNQNIDLPKSSLVISSIKEEESKLDSYCPYKAKNSKVWISPESEKQNFYTLCLCTKNLLENEVLNCSQKMGRDEFARQLQLAEFEQLGGQAGFYNSALAWQKTNVENQISLTSFLIPLQPKRSTGLGHSFFPQSIKLFLDHSQNKEKEGSKKRETSHVPRGESLLYELEEAKFPPLFSEELLAKTLTEKNSQIDSFMILLILLILMGASLMLESIYHFSKKKFLIFAFLVFSFNQEELKASYSIDYLVEEEFESLFSEPAFSLEQRTSLYIEKKINFLNIKDQMFFKSPWLWVSADLFFKQLSQDSFSLGLTRWIKQGGFLILEENKNGKNLEKISLLFEDQKHLKWTKIPPDHELLKSFYLLNTMPSCSNDEWYILEYDDRLVGISIPYSLIKELQKKQNIKSTCKLDLEMLTRTFVNINMVALATDYKKDQIHLDEILKRLK